MPLFSHATGDGPTVLLLHGLGASSHVWEPLRALAPNSLRLVAVDLPCSGRSGNWAGPSPQAIAQRLLSWLPDGELRVVGHSFGGVVGLELWNQAPERVRGLALLACPALGIGRFGMAVHSPLASWVAKVASLPDPSVLAVRAYLKFIWGKGPAPTPGMVQGYLAAMGTPDFFPRQVECLRALSEYRLPSSAHRASPPLRVLAGSEDPLVPAVRSKELAQALGAEFQLLEGAGHCLPEEQPQAVWKTLSSLVEVVHPLTQ